MLQLLDLGMAYVPAEGGYMVSERHARIAEILQDYDPALELAWIPPDKREPGDKPFAVVHRPGNQPPYVVFYSDDPDESLLTRIFDNDNSRKDVLSVMEARNAAQKAMDMKIQMEKAEERMDLVSHIWNGKHYYRHGGVLYQ